MEASSNVQPKKHEEIRKIALCDSYQEFYNSIMLSLSSGRNEDGKQYLSDHIPMSLVNTQKKKKTISFKYQDGEKDWISFDNQEEYQQAFLLAKEQKSLRVKVVYKKSMFKPSSGASKASKHQISQNHSLTISVEFEKLQELLRLQSNQANSNKCADSSSDSTCIFDLWNKSAPVQVDV